MDSLQVLTSMQLGHNSFHTLVFCDVHEAILLYHGNESSCLQNKYRYSCHGQVTPSSLMHWCIIAALISCNRIFSCCWFTYFTL